MRKYSDVVIIGAGASGLLCGGLLGEAGMSVTVVEKNDRPGKKLSATGNGRCNFTNTNMGVDFYYGDREWIAAVLKKSGPKDVIRQFEEIGVLHRERDGYVYPHTNQAVTVVDSLIAMCRKSRVEILTNCKASGIVPEADGEYFSVRTPDGVIRCRYAVLATGGKANRESGGDGSGYKLAKSLGHHLNPVYPGLTGLKCRGTWWPRAAGTRIEGRFSLLIDGKKTEGEYGEIQTARDGVSGIPVFQLCRLAAAALADGKWVEGVIDFVPPMEEEMLKEWIRRHGLEGLLPTKWVPVFSGRAEPARELKNFTFPIVDTYGLERAQISAGGVPTSEVSPETMESRQKKNVFLLGELLDVDGICGGYNLHFAWSSAMAAAGEIAKRDRKEAVR